MVRPLYGILALLQILAQMPSRAAGLSHEAQQPDVSTYKFKDVDHDGNTQNVVLYGHAHATYLHSDSAQYLRQGPVPIEIDAGKCPFATIESGLFCTVFYIWMFFRCFVAFFH